MEIHVGDMFYWMGAVEYFIRINGIGQDYFNVSFARNKDVQNYFINPGIKNGYIPLSNQKGFIPILQSVE